MKTHKNCLNCIHLSKTKICTVLNEFIYPEYFVHDDSGFYVEGYKVESPSLFSCNQWSEKNEK